MSEQKSDQTLVKNLKILTVGDPHFKKSNIPDCDLLITKLHELIIKEAPTYIIILGDVLDTHETIDECPLNKALEFINMCRKYAPTYILVGNHDYRNNSQFLTENHWMNGLKEWENCVIVDKVVELKMSKNTKFYLLPYVPDGRFVEALNTYEYSTIDKWKDATGIFCHQEFLGCKMGAFISEKGDKWELDHPFVISGHIHQQQQPQENIYYTGSSLQNAFGESEKNIIAIFEWDYQLDYQLDYNYNTPLIREVDLDLPRKKIIYMDMGKVDDFVVDTSKDNSKLKLTLTGNTEEFKTFKKTAKYQELVKNDIKVVFKGVAEIATRKSDKILFKDVLHELLLECKNPLVMEYYNEIFINN